jgi:hypothetical protein
MGIEADKTFSQKKKKKQTRPELLQWISQKNATLWAAVYVVFRNLVIYAFPAN